MSSVSPKNPFEVARGMNNMDKISEVDDIDDKDESSSAELDRNDSALTFELPLVSVNRKGTIK